jgi:hemerythrin-like domain-containing protein
MEKIPALFTTWYTPARVTNQKRPGKYMRIIKNLKADQETIKRFLDVLGAGSVVLGKNKLARPSFFILAYSFIHEYVEQGFFKKEEFLIRELEDAGFPSETGPIASILTDHKKCREAAELLINASKQWQDGDDVARGEVTWAVSQYTSTCRQHLERIKNLIIPLLEQSFSLDEEHKISEDLDNLHFESAYKRDPGKYTKLIETLEDQLSDWK